MVYVLVQGAPLGQVFLVLVISIIVVNRLGYALV